MTYFIGLDNNKGREIRCDITADSDQVPFIVINLETVNGDMMEEILIEKKEEADNFLEAVKKAHGDFLEMLKRSKP